MDYLAHSGKGETPKQHYSTHAGSVNKKAVCNILEALRFFTGSDQERRIYGDAVDCGSLFHDLGKLDEKNQEVLSRKNSKEKLPLNHSDAGTSWLLKNGAVNGARLVYCHHAGLFSRSDELTKNGGNLAFRDMDISDEVDRHLTSYVERHSMEVGSKSIAKDTLVLKGFPFRLALSCIVDADHHDTALHYGQESEVVEIPPKWAERLNALEIYVRGLQKKGADDLRNRLRRRMFTACVKAPSEPPVKCCDAPVGSGKTTAIMAHLLQTAAKKGLRHIFVVLPYTNIIEQSVDIYRKSLVLPGENPEHIVAAHYHQADFSDLNTRHLTTLWKAPVIVTSAVQFFETLAACKTSRLRKLHELPGSAIFLDESHAAMPMKIWPQQWQWMGELAKEWGTYFVLASGSLVKFWEFPIFSSALSVPNLLQKDLRKDLTAFEKRRVIYPDRLPPLTRFELIELILSKAGPRLVILNTVQSAAVVAHEMKKAGHNVLHLSTALAPVDRKGVIETVNAMLADRSKQDWILVATSCVEAGVDFSFKTAFRESCSVTSLLQTGGRANRQGMETDCEIIDFRVRDPLLNLHPAFDAPRTVLDEMFDQKLMNRMSPMELATESVRREIEKNTVIVSAEEIMKLESKENYKIVAEKARIIDADTRVVIVTPEIVEKLKNRKKVTFKEILENSAQLWSKKIDYLGLTPFERHDELYFWGDYPYDPEFLGYMKGLIPLVYEKEEWLII